ncbi:hypothetical protein [Nocardia sp. NPDC005825]|uniref:hypothetical protein n=1 Tax=unclassified Nocardia TaxID=2637762 RepID=UPI00340CF08E
MSAIVSVATQSGGWAIVWLQLPLLVLALAVLSAVVIALLRAKQEDIPKLLGMITAGLGRWPEWFRPRNRGVGQGSRAAREDRSSAVLEEER